MRQTILVGGLFILGLMVVACSDSAWSEGSYDGNESGGESDGDGDGDTDGDGDGDGDGDVDTNDSSGTADPVDTSDNDVVRQTCPVNQGTHDCVVNRADCRALGGTVDNAYTCASGTCCQLPAVNPGDADADGDTDGDEDVECTYTCVDDMAACLDLEGVIITSEVCDNGQRCCDVGATTDADADTDEDPDGGVEYDAGDAPDGGTGESCPYNCMSAVACLMEDGDSLGTLDCPENEICCTVGETPTDTGPDNRCAGTCLESAVSCIVDFGGTQDPDGVCDNDLICCVSIEEQDSETNDTATESDTAVQDTDTREECPVGTMEGAEIQCISGSDCTSEEGYADGAFKCSEAEDVCCVIAILPDCPEEMSCVSPSGCDAPGLVVEEGYDCSGNQVCCNDTRLPCPTDLEEVACTSSETCDDFGFDVDLGYICPDQGDICCVNR